MSCDPIPDPLAAGWTKEGNEPHFRRTATRIAWRSAGM
jgi:hypothetical protein